MNLYFNAGRLGAAHCEEPPVLVLSSANPESTMQAAFAACNKPGQWWRSEQTLQPATGQVTGGMVNKLCSPQHAKSAVAQW